MTFDKQDGLSRILSQHISVVREILKKSRWANPRYQYIDLTAGCGYNEEIDCVGSPIIFQKAIKQAGLSYDAHFIEIEPTNTMILCGALQADRHITIHTGDHSIIAPEIVKTWPTSPGFGMIYVDPNGVPPFNLLADLSHNPKLKRVDFLIRYTGAGAKRAGYRLLDELDKIDKRYWIVRDLGKRNNWQWTFLFGLNWNGLRPMRRHGFHSASSTKGRTIIERLHYTVPELKALHQPELPFLI